MRSSASALAKGWAIQGRVITALMLRDVVMRYGRANIGFAWVILEPMLLCTGVMILWSVTSGADRQGVNLVEFILTGYMLLTLWRHMTNSMLSLGRRSASLLYHRQISLFDVVWAKLVLEFAATTTALLIIGGTLYALGLVRNFDRLDLCILGWLMMAWFAGAAGLIFVGVSERTEVFEKFVAPAQYLIIPISGSFIMVDWVPQWAQKYLLLNPLVHPYEVFRAGYFGASVVTHYSFLYFACCCLLLTFWGVGSVQRARYRLRLN
jgi:capsular polysaccharide transport system permease protein